MTPFIQFNTFSDAEYVLFVTTYSYEKSGTSVTGRRCKKVSFSNSITLPDDGRLTSMIFPGDLESQSGVQYLIDFSKKRF